MAAVVAWPAFWALYGCRGGWPIPWVSSGRRGGVARLLSPVYGRREGVARLLISVWPPWGRGTSPGPLMAAVWAFPVPWDPCDRCVGVARPWAPHGCCGGMARLLGLARLPRERGLSPGPRMAAVEAWLVSWAPSGHVGEWPTSWAQYGRRGGVACSLGPVWLPWGRGPSPGFRMAAVRPRPVPVPCMARGGVARPQGFVLPPWGVAFPYAPYGCRGSVVRPLGPVLPVWGRGPSFLPRMATVGAWPVTWGPYRRRGGVARPLGLVWLPWGRGQFPVPRMAAVET